MENKQMENKQMTKKIKVSLTAWQLLAIETSLEKNDSIHAGQKAELLKLLNDAERNAK